MYYVGKLEGKVGCGMAGSAGFAYTGVCVLIWCWTILHFAVGAAAHIVLSFCRSQSNCRFQYGNHAVQYPAASYIGGIAGGGRSIAGAAYQGMFKNPMVSPDILGASAGAGFGACLAILMELPTVYVQMFSFCGGILAVFIAATATRRFSMDPILGLVLGGMMVSTLFQSGTSTIKILADADNKLPQITFWLMGSFNVMNKAKLFSILIPIGAGFLILFLVRWQLNVLSFGEDEASSLGIKTKRIRSMVIIASTLITASCVSVCGMVGWVGLVIPHAGRALAGPDYRRLLPVCAILGSTFLLLVDDVARTAFMVELPIGILTSFIGVPFFMFIFKSGVNKGGSA